MKMPLQWAQSYANFSCTPQEFADKMTMSGSKVETYSSEADTLQHVVVGRIASIQRHPDADHLWVCQVDVGSETIQIVTGAQNLKEGDLCPAALHGAKLPNGTEIRRGKLRGEISNGMLCSLAELGLTLHDFPTCAEDGIMVLAQDATPGTSAATALGMDDTTFAFEITPNRPDCLSVRGLAREAAATFGATFKDTPPPAPTGSGDIAQHLQVQIKATDTCNRYMAAMVDNVRIAPSPLWLRQRLRLCGVRPINNIVDITNYVMLEYGQPMHAFDFAYVNGGKLTVRNAAPGENIVTLDEEQRALTPEMMVIADENGPVAIAGIMGGEHSGVYETTRQVVFESASFAGPSVRSTSRRLGLRTESSSRFEKGLDPENAKAALYRALQLVAELDAGDIIGGILDAYPNPPAPHSLALQPKSITNLLGVGVTAQQMQDILLPLGFTIEGEVIHIPSARADVQRQCDIAEEIARFIGYNTLPTTVLRGVAAAVPSAKQRFYTKVCNTMVGYGFWECETFSFYSPKAFDMINLPQDSPLRKPVHIANPLGEDTSIMRTTALPSMLEVVARNWAARNETCALFEQATAYTPDENPENLPTEVQKLLLAAYGESWDYLALKGAVEGLLASFGIHDFTIRRNSQGASFHPGRCADLYVASPHTAPGSEVLLATFGEIHPLVCATYGIKPRVVAADIHLGVLFAAKANLPQFSPLPKFPAVTRDLALVADEDVPAADIAKTIRTAAGKRLEKLTLFDIYTGGSMEDGKKSLAYSLVLRDSAATLTDKEADAITNKILKQLAPLQVVLRS